MSDLRKRFSYKTVILGDNAVGKSSIVTRYISNSFYEFQEPTIGAAFLASEMKIDDNQIKFEIWDTAGQERYRSLAPMYYRGARAAIIAYDITNRESFIGAKGWVKEVFEKGNSNCYVILVGNKVDLENDRRVNKSEVDEYAENHNIVHIETSAKNANGVKKIFEIIGKELIDSPVEESNDLLQNYENNSKIKSSCC